ncbi:MAG TPA: DEAD/DEAH box helicase [Rhodocyclaceae bacterium]
MNPSDSFTASDVANWLSQREVDKAQSYLDAVSGLEVGTDQIDAKVQGTAAKPYRVQIKLAANGHNFPAQISCSCPVGGYCQHVAAALLKTIAGRSASEQATPAATGWLDALRLLSAGPVATPLRTKMHYRLFWVINYVAELREFRIGCGKGRADEQGRPQGKTIPWHNFEQALARPFTFIGDDDLAVIRLLLAQRKRGEAERADLPLAGRHGGEILARLLDSGRLYCGGIQRQPLSLGAARPARVHWQQDEHGRFCALALAEPSIAWALPLEPPWYVDGERCEVGRLEFNAPAAAIARILAAPPMSEIEALLATELLADAAPDLPLPTLQAARMLELAPQPELILGTLEGVDIEQLRAYPERQKDTELDVAQIGFRYGETLFGWHDSREVVTLANGETVQIKRRADAEARWLERLQQIGFSTIPRFAIQLDTPSDLSRYWVLAHEDAWSDFMAEHLPQLRAEGWRVDMPDSFRHHFVEVEEWEAEISEADKDWFDLDMGIVVGGRRQPLAPLLAELFRHDQRWLDGLALAHIDDSETVDLISEEGRRIRVKAARIKPLARTLLDLFDRLPSSGPLRISRLDAPRLMDLGHGGWRVDGMVAVQRMAEQIGGLGGVQPVAPPAGFNLELRGYQREGLAWLQYLREHGLAGILADDMGLGKTAQTLAHLLLEKEAGRLDRPALVVLPTSLIFNWEAEAARYAPGLSVLSLQGKARKERFAEIPRHDLVLTTYPLLWRDAEDLAKHQYHLLILDEAQTVKNAASKGAAVVRQIDARHRLCLTGTPLENHLGELWSQFDFLLPGFLGDAKSFAKTWRTPIEKHGNRMRAELLVQRIRPFILRRRKEDVAKELPPKTIIPRSVELEGSQRDLYETVRSAMDLRVRQEIAARGFAASQIVILDALLKLRQVCCDPRLVNSEAAHKVKQRAKLDQLMGMLPELVDEGRKVLVFSQFTSMLALIEAELQQAGLGYALLTGQTKDREAQIKRFQDGAVPIFLISLKAGGIGLNLTTADTVIHYDPWWNPAVENQASDRAHRLGQTKPVFVYKLIVAGSIEEKIVAMQEQKAELAKSILSDDGVGTVKFSEADIRALLAPLPPPK